MKLFYTIAKTLIFPAFLAIQTLYFCISFEIELLYF